MAEEKIPVLTEVYKPKKAPKKASASADSAPEITPEMLAKITSQIKPRLEAEITDFVLDELRSEIQKARDEIISTTKDFVDKTKADLKTELPNMYHESVKLAEVNLTEKFADMHVEATSKFDTAISDIATTITENSQGDMDQQVQQSIEKAMEAYHPQALANYQEKLDKQLEEASLSLQASFDASAEHLQKTYQESVENAEAALSERTKNAEEAFNEKVSSAEAVFTERASNAETAFKEASHNSLQTALAEHQSALQLALDSILEAQQQGAETGLREQLSAMKERVLAEHTDALNLALEGQMQTQGEAAERALLSRIQEYQNQLRAENEQEMTANMLAARNEITERIEESTTEQVGLMHSQVGSIQQETFAKLREDFNAEKNAIFEAAANHIKTSFADQMKAQSEEIREQFLTQVNGDLPQVQSVLQENIQTILTNLVPDIEQSLRDQLTTELKQLLLTVKFVLPE